MALLSSGDPGLLIDFEVRTALSVEEVSRRLESSGWKGGTGGFRRGSQVWLRLFGVYLIAPTRWPLTASIERHEGESIVRVRDNFGKTWKAVAPEGTESKDLQNWGSAKRLASGFHAISQGARSLEAEISGVVSA